MTKEESTFAVDNEGIFEGWDFSEGVMIHAETLPLKDKIQVPVQLELSLWDKTDTDFDSSLRGAA